MFVTRKRMDLELAHTQAIGEANYARLNERFWQLHHELEAPQNPPQGAQCEGAGADGIQEHGMKDIVSTLIALGVVVVFILLSASCGIARYNECRTEHPWWYCINR